MQTSAFSFKGADVRTVTIDGAPWWIAQDVCDVLEIRNSRQAVSRLDEDEKGVIKTDTLGGQQDLSVVSEPGMYKLIARSNKSEAKAFLRWVTHEVLPTIRKTGGYQIAHRDAVSEVDRVAAMLGAMLPAIARLGQIDTAVEDQGARLAAVEERQRVTDPREIEVRMFLLHQIKRRLVEATKGASQAVTHQGYWRSLKEHCQVSSFQHRAALDVPLMREGDRVCPQLVFRARRGAAARGRRFGGLATTRGERRERQ